MTSQRTHGSGWYRSGGSVEGAHEKAGPGDSKPYTTHEVLRTPRTSRKRPWNTHIQQKKKYELSATILTCAGACFVVGGFEEAGNELNLRLERETTDTTQRAVKKITMNVVSIRDEIEEYIWHHGTGLVSRSANGHPFRLSLKTPVLRQPRFGRNIVHHSTRRDPEDTKYEIQAPTSHLVI